MTDTPIDIAALEALEKAAVTQAANGLHTSVAQIEFEQALRKHARALIRAYHEAETLAKEAAEKAEQDTADAYGVVIKSLEVELFKARAEIAALTAERDALKAERDEAIAKLEVSEACHKPKTLMIASLRAALETASEIAEAAPELNMRNYDESQVSELNDAMVKLTLHIRSALTAARTK